MNATDPFRGIDHRGWILKRDGQPLAEKAEQLPAPLLVGERDRDGLIDPAGTSRERRLEHVGAIGGHEEDHVGVEPDAVDLVHQLEQKRRGPVHHALLRHEIDVLQHDHRGSEGIGQ